ncbi:ROK family protein [candidate division KSB1 bacterium]
MKPDSQVRHALGIDLGGTKIASAVVTTGGALLNKEETPTEAEDGADRVVENLKTAVHRTVAWAAEQGLKLSGIGLAAGGSIDVNNTRVVTATEVIPGWTGVDLMAAVDSSLPVIADNDVNAAAFGEYCLGDNKRPSSLALVAVGTGIGGGLVIDGKVCRGANWLAADLGHLKIVPGGRKCLCGATGCLEAYSSGWAIAGRYRETAATDESERIDAGLVLRRAAGGDPVATSVMDQAVDCLCLALANLIVTIDPEVLTLTGGVIERNPELIERIEPGIESYLRKGRIGRTQIRVSRFGRWAGVVGAACLLFKELGLG